MGSSQSKSRALEQALTAKLAERLHVLELETNERRPIVEEKGHEYPQRSQFPNVSIAAAEQWQKELLKHPKNRLAISAFTANSAAEIIGSRPAKISDIQVFNVKVPLEGSPITDQKASGRCWLFATTNVFRVAFMKKYNLENFQLSQAYLFFWDKLEKANYFLESIIETTDKPLDGRLLQSLMSGPVGDGGQWDMAANLVKKYGLVPQSLYPDAFNAENSATMSRLITTKLREDSLRLRAIVKSSSPKDLASAKDHMLQEVHRILTLMLGPPPSPSKAFEWEFYDKDKKFHSVTITPKDFAAQLSDTKTVKATGTDVNTLFSLVHDPRNPFYRLLTVEYLGNVSDGREITYINVPMSVMKEACIAMLKKGIPIFFGVDVGKDSDTKTGIMDTKLYDYELGFDVHLGMNKSERMMTGESAMTHAMVLTAVHLENGT